MISARASAMMAGWQSKGTRGLRLSAERRSTGTATRLVAAAGTCAVLLLSGLDARAQGASAGCDDAGIAVLPSPITPWKGAPLRVIFTSEKPLDGELALI